MIAATMHIRYEVDIAGRRFTGTDFPKLTRL
jgi:hypothetical protein